MTPTDDLKNFVPPSLTSHEHWTEVTKFWRAMPEWATKYPLIPYSHLKRQDEHLLRMLESFADATGRIGSALEGLAKMPPHPGDLDSRERQFVEYEKKITIGYQDAYRALHRVAQAFEAFEFALEENRRRLPDEVLKAMGALAGEIESARSGFAKLDLTERSHGLMPLGLSSRLNAVILPAPQKRVALEDLPLTDTTVTPANWGRAASEPQRRPGTESSRSSPSP